MKLLFALSAVVVSLFLVLSLPHAVSAGDKHHKRGGDAFAQALECHNATCQPATAAQPVKHTDSIAAPVAQPAKAVSSETCTNGSCSTTGTVASGSCSDGSCSSGSRRSHRGR